MRILIAHNRYQISGGEDRVVENEADLLKRQGHDVSLFLRTNDDIQTSSDRFRTARQATHSHDSQRVFSKELTQLQPDVVHVHNFFPLITPSIYQACLTARVPVVQTLHNFRTLCANSLLSRNNRPCELCIQGSPYQAVLFGCYRQSRLGSLAVARMIAHHRKRRTWETEVDHFFALSEFSKSKFLKGGFPKDRISVKPNFVPQPRNEIHPPETSGPKTVFYVGRLSQEKGIHTLLKAAEILRQRKKKKEAKIRIQIAGDGPLRSVVESEPAVDYRGPLSRPDLENAYSKASFVVLPSECYENFPMSVAEAFSQGRAVLVSNFGSMAEIVKTGETGRHFQMGNAESLATEIAKFCDEPQEYCRMGQNARQTYLDQYTPEKNYETLISVYTRLSERRARTRSAPLGEENGNGKTLNHHSHL